MGFLSFGKTKEEKQKENDKVIHLATIKLLVNRCDEMLGKLDKAEDCKERNYLKNQINQTKHNLEDAYKYFQALNIKFTVEELKKADKNITSKDFDDCIDYLIKINKRRDEYSFNKLQKSNVSEIRDQIIVLLKDIPKLE